MGSLAKKLRGGSTQPGRRLFHYTIGDYIQTIIESGEIRTTGGAVPAGERHAAWFSFHPEWEETANKGLMNALGERRGLNREETAQFSGGLARIEIKPRAAPHDWRAFLRRARVGSRMAEGLVLAAREVGSDPAHWRVSFSAVHAVDWIAVEIFEGDAWVPHPTWKEKK